MKLPNPFTKQKKEQTSEYFLALLLTDEKASAVILQEQLGKVKIISKHEEFFSSSLEAIDQEAFITLIDKTVSKAEEVLPPKVETHKTVFGVKESWVDPDTKKITKEYLTKLKKVCDALDLTPIGFMVVTEAISHLLQEEEGAPLSAILAEVGHKTVALALYRGGKVVERIDGPVEDSAAATVDKLLRHFTVAVLPARIILFDAKDAEKLSQQFIGHQWSKSLPFLHVPQITVLPEGYDGRAVTFGAAAQMGFDVLDEDMPQPKALTLPTEEADEKRNEEPQETKKEETSTISADNFGFVVDQDIATMQPPVDERVEEHATEEIPSEVADFAVNLHQEQPESYEIKKHSSQKKMPNIFALVSAHMPHMKLALPSFGKNKNFVLPLIILVVVLGLIGSIIFFYLYKVQANVILSVKPNIVTQDTNVVFSATSPSDFSKNVIAAKSITTTVDGDLSIDTTGKKDVGDKAKGTVTIYNNAETSAKVESGTTIKSSNGLLFLTDKDISIASASGDIFSGTKPGTTQVAVTAKEIGTDSNLPSGTKFTIGSNSSLAAKNDSAFSGGTKKQVTVVSKNDIAKLKTDLPKSLEDKARTALSQKATDSETLLPLLTVASLDKAKFDKNVDDEAKKVKLTASVVFNSMSYQNDELTNYGKSLIKSKYAQDISIADKSIKNTIKDTKQKNENEVETTVTIEAGLLPNINTADVIEKLQGKSLQQTQLIIKGLPQVAQSQITFSPSLPFLPNIFPTLPKHITVEVRSQ